MSLKLVWYRFLEENLDQEALREGKKRDGGRIPKEKEGYKEFSLQGHQSFGSSESNDFIVPGLCSEHFKIVNEYGRCELYKDEKGPDIFVNSKKIRQVALYPGDMVRAGRNEFLVMGEKEEFPLAPLISQSSTWNQTVLRLPAYAKSELPILILGESGVGKEVLSKALHKLSSRGNQKVLSVNCSALTLSLAESELFGHVKGAFTGASQDRMGAFEEARGGTLILDEVGDLPLEIQPKLLRALENSEIKPLGSDKVVQINCRVIACTNHDLFKKVQRGEFRLDLYHRLNVLQIRIPSISERPEDFESLLMNFCREQGVCFSYGAIQVLKTTSWKGNIRELKNFVSLCRVYYPHERIDVEQVKYLISSRGEQVEEAQRNVSDVNLMKQMEREVLYESLKRNKGNRLRVARELGMPKSTVYDKVKYYGLEIGLLEPQV